MRHPRNAIILCFIYITFLGCQRAREFSCVASDIGSYRGKKISAVTLKNGDLKTYDKMGGTYYEERNDSSSVQKIVGFDQNNQPQNIDLKQILEVQCQSIEPDPGGTVLTVLVSAGVGGFLLLLLIFSNTKFN